MYPPTIWNADEVEAILFEAATQAFHELCAESNFTEGWKNWQVVEGTKTMLRSAPLLGKGGGARDVGGLWRFAEKYVRSDPDDELKDVLGRCSYERYNDFQFYSAGYWYDGHKRLLLAAEVESNNAELLGELSGLLTVRCPFKLLFIAPRDDLFERLTEYCANPSNVAVDWAGTSYWVSEIPNEPLPPTQWIKYRADVTEHGDKLRFRRVP